MTVSGLFVESLQEAYMLAHGERLNELRGTRQRLLDARGIHPFSAAWGRVEAAVALDPDLSDETLSIAPWALMKAAREDADAEFRAEILEREGIASEPQPRANGSDLRADAPSPSKAVAA